MREENERKVSQGREIPAVRLARRFRSARRRQRRRPRLSSTRNEGEVAGRGGGGATRKKVCRLQRSEKLRFRSQHRRHSSVSFSTPAPRRAVPPRIPFHMHPSATAATGI